MLVPSKGLPARAVVPNTVVLRNVPLYVRVNENLPILDRPASGRATDWPGGIRTRWRSLTFLGVLRLREQVTA